MPKNNICSVKCAIHSNAKGSSRDPTQTEAAQALLSISLSDNLRDPPLVQNSCSSF